MIYLLDINIFTIITILIQSLLIVLINQVTFVSDNLNMLKGLLPLVNLIILILTVSVILSIKELESNTKRKIETELLKTHLKQVEGLVTTLQVQKHEYARHMQIIQAMLYLDELDDVKNYINGISKKYRHSESMVYVGNPALTALLNSKKEMAENLDIAFDFAVKCNIDNVGVPSWDLCSIIGNLLDNAFEAVSRREDDRSVGLEIKLEDNKYKIYVYNNGCKISPVEKKLIFRKGYTTKKSRARGYGLYIVKALTNQYKGKIEIRSDKKTTFIVSFFMEKRDTKNGQTSLGKIGSFIRGKTASGLR